MNWPWKRKKTKVDDDPLATETDERLYQLERRLMAIKLNRDIVGRRWNDDGPGSEHSHSR